MSSSDKKSAAQKSHGPINTASAGTGETHLPKTISPAKVAANRRNAQKATGPRTAEGKARSRWNAVQHGLLSKRLALVDAEGNRAFVRLLASLSEDLRPQGALEEILVEKNRDRLLASPRRVRPRSRFCSLAHIFLRVGRSHEPVRNLDSSPVDAGYEPVGTFAAAAQRGDCAAPGQH